MPCRRSDVSGSIKTGNRLPIFNANACIKSKFRQKYSSRRYFRQDVLTMTAFATVIAPVALGVVGLCSLEILRARYFNYKTRDKGWER
jgi:hypothetical protein